MTTEINEYELRDRQVRAMVDAYIAECPPAAPLHRTPRPVQQQLVITALISKLAQHLWNLCGEDAFDAWWNTLREQVRVSTHPPR